jgi:hypothetical protein
LAQSLSRYHFVVFGVRPDEEPQDYLVSRTPDRAIIVVDPDRPQIIVRGKLLKLKAGMAGVFLEELIGLAGLPANRGGKSGQVPAKIRAGARDHN